MRLVDAREIKEVVESKAKDYFAGEQAKVVIISANDDLASKRYVDMKHKAFARVGVECDVVHIPEYLSEDDVLNRMFDILDTKGVSGVMVQMPVWEHLDPQMIIDLIPWYKDIDGLSTINQGGLYCANKREGGVRPCTAVGVMNWLEYTGFEFEGKSAVIVGRGALVADPLAKMLENLNMTVTKIHTKTPYDRALTHIWDADLIVSCAGRNMEHLISPKFVRSHATVIGVGFRYEDGKQLQDFNLQLFEKSKHHTGCITPNTAGTGMMTINALLNNTRICHETTKRIEGGLL